MSENNTIHNISIPDYYDGKVIFITGATGFVGKVLLDKLLRSCPNIEKIYILIREKKGKTIEKRLQIMLSDQLFDILKTDCPGVVEKKLIPLKGDCQELKLGLSDADWTLLTSSVNVIFHVAASVRFDDSLRDAILLNTRGTQEVCQLALESKNLDLFTHVSTTYCNCVIGQEIGEQLYPPPADWRKIIQIAEQFDKDQLVCFTDKFLGPYPNTYTFTKALSEHVVNDMCVGRIPALICRPSIVVSSLKDPVVGWIDNFNGPVGLLVACGKGLLRTSYQDPDVNSDYIPVDIVVKAIIVASWDLALRRQNKRVEIVHCSSGYHKWLTIGEVIILGRTLSKDIPLNDCLWVPKGFVTKCRFLAYVNIILFHLLPAFFFDIILKLVGHKPMIARLQTKIFNASLQLRYFTFQEWHFVNDNLLKNQEKILDCDRNDWDYEFRTEDVGQFMINCMIGARKYLLKESEDSLTQARKHYNRMYWLDKVAMFFFYLLLIYMALKFQVVEKFLYFVASRLGFQ